MSYIKVYDSDISDQFTKVQLHYQLYFFNYLPYVLIDDLRAIDENAIGLFGLDKENERVAQSKYGERLYLYAIDGIPVEHGRFILNYSKGPTQTTAWTRSDKTAVVSAIFGGLSFTWAVVVTFWAGMIKKNI